MPVMRSAFKHLAVLKIQMRRASIYVLDFVCRMASALSMAATSTVGACPRNVLRGLWQKFATVAIPDDVYRPMNVAVSNVDLATQNPRTMDVMSACVWTMVDGLVLNGGVRKLMCVIEMANP